ncbi:MAG: ATP synthase F0 subunit B [Ignavibacteria bacterium]|nr:MAG: ATP synthase F0 subunit B [Ignavibacteria bacterium]
MLAIKNLAVLAFSGGEMGSPLDINPGVIFWTVITFVILLFILKKVAWKPILSTLDEREKMIKDSLEKAEKAKEEAEKLIAENQANIAKAEEEAQKVIAQSREYAETLKNQLIEEGKAEKKKLIDDALAELERKNQEAFLKLKEQVADIAIEAAEKIIRENLDREKQIELVNKHLEKFSN